MSKKYGIHLALKILFHISFALFISFGAPSKLNAAKSTVYFYSKASFNFSIKRTCYYDITNLFINVAVVCGNTRMSATQTFIQGSIGSWLVN